LSAGGCYKDGFRNSLGLIPSLFNDFNDQEPFSENFKSLEMYHTILFRRQTFKIQAGIVVD
jgi:hypothetical protein